MQTKLKLEIDLRGGTIASVEDVAQILRVAADQLLKTCGAECEFSPRCQACWSDLPLRDAAGNTVGSGVLVVE